MGAGAGRVDLVEGSPQWHPASLSPAMGELLERFPLFPLGLVLLPGEVVPLHIFEERYKTMIGECLERGVGVRDPVDGRRRAPGGRAAPRTSTGARAHGRRPDEHRSCAARARSASSAGSTTWSTRRATSSCSTTTRRPRPRRRRAAHESYADLVERVTDTRPEAGRPRRARRLRHGGHDRVRSRRQAGAARAPLGVRAPDAPGLALRVGARALRACRAAPPSARRPTARCTTRATFTFRRRRGKPRG